MRKVVVWDKVNQQEIVLLTNHLDFGATTISAIYTDRWQIELFFKALKQNLKVKTFVGTSENALYIQIWTALIAILLVKFLQFKAKFGWSLSEPVAFLRWNLFTYRNLWDSDRQSFRCRAHRTKVRPIPVAIARYWTAPVLKNINLKPKNALFMR